MEVEEVLIFQADTTELNLFTGASKLESLKRKRNAKKYTESHNTLQ